MYAEPMHSHTNSKGCVCTDGLDAYRDVSEYCDCPILSTEQEIINIKNKR